MKFANRTPDGNLDTVPANALVLREHELYGIQQIAGPGWFKLGDQFIVVFADPPETSTTAHKPIEPGRIKRRA